MTTTPPTPKHETRGRPRKNIHEKLPEISRQLFSEHQAVFYSTCLLYVLELFEQTLSEKIENEKHFSCGFAIYDRLLSANNNNKDNSYSFENITKDCEEWGFDKILENERLLEFVKIVNGCAPKVVFREMLELIEDVVLLIEEVGEEIEMKNLEERQQLEEEEELKEEELKHEHKEVANEFKEQEYEQLETHTIDLLLARFLKLELESQTSTTPQPKLTQNEHLINSNNNHEKYKYIKFTYTALKEIGLEKYHEKIQHKLDLYELWFAFVNIIVYTIYCVVHDVKESKYYRMLFYTESTNNGSSDSNNSKTKDYKELSLSQIVGFFDKKKETQLSKVEPELEELEEKNLTKYRFQPILLSNESEQEYNHHHQSRKKIKSNEDN